MALVQGLWGEFAIELAFVGLVIGLLALLRFGHGEVALGIYAVVLPLLFISRYFLSVLDPLSDRNPLYSDYLLEFAMLNLVLLTLVSSRVRHVLVGGFLYALAGLANFLWVLLPANLNLAPQSVTAPMVRYYLLLGILVLLLVFLQRIIRETTRKNQLSERHLEVLVQERTSELTETQGRLERARSVLTEGEKLASLGRIVAGITHEVNSPLAAIQAAQSHQQAQLTRVFDAWISLNSRLDADLVQRLLSLVHRAERDVSRLDPRQNRDRRQTFQTWLEGHAVPRPSAVATALADLEVPEMDEAWLPLLLSRFQQEALEVAIGLVDLERSNSIIGLAVNKAITHVGALKKYGRSTSNKPLETVDLGLNLETVLLVYRGQIPSRVKVVTKLEKTGPWVLGDPDRLMQVWSNLLQNAIQALTEGGTVTIDTFVRQSWVVVEFVDDGPGVPKEIQSRILEPFFTTKAQGEGTGLGLEIVRGIVEDLGGRLSFESEPGRTVFRVRLPASTPPSS